MSCVERKRRTLRPGTTVLEVIAASAILAVLLIVCAQMVSRTAVQQRAISNRRAASQMTANAMERVWALPGEEMDQEALDAITTAVLSEKMLRRARLEVIVDDSEGRPARKRIRITATWYEGSDGVQRRQQLTAWRYADASTSVGEGDPADRRSGEEVTP